ncbi:MAG: hypothetical protein IVW52_00335 [Acidimicrobiales bacterium]|nr:hypothetical protein [Acidimicrobiales bacterium]
MGRHGVQALLWGVRSEGWESPDHSNPLLEGPAEVPMHFPELVSDGRIDLSGMLTHTFRLSEWREAFTALATQTESNAIKVAFDFR